MKTAKKVLTYWLPVFLWMALIYFLSSFHKLQASEISWQDFIIRKTAHFLEYGILYVLFNRALTNTGNLVFKKRIITVLVLCLVYAFSDEFHQTFVSGRSGRMIDFLIDSLGAGAGLLFVVKFIYKLPKKVQQLVV